MTISSSKENLIASIVINLDELTAENEKIRQLKRSVHLTIDYLENGQWNQRQKCVDI